jgi:hypothetical protein
LKNKIEIEKDSSLDTQQKRFNTTEEIDAEENGDESIEEKGLDVEIKDFGIEEFEIIYSKEEVGCIHELVTPKGTKRIRIDSLT